MERAWIELEVVEAIVKTASKAKFFIELHSSCLEGFKSFHHHVFTLEVNSLIQLGCVMLLLSEFLIRVRRNPAL